MQKNNWLISIGIIVLVALGAWWWTRPAPAAPQQAGQGTQARTLVNTAVYACDKGKTITAAYYSGPAAPKPAPGEPPIPTGSVDVSFDGAPTTTLAQTISADGARYSDGDPQVAQGQPGAETLVFWSKGDSALIMRDNAMDLDYTNCTVATSSPSA